LWRAFFLYAPPMTKFDWKKIDAAVRVEPSAAAPLRDRDPEGEGLFADKDEAKDHVEKCAKEIDALQDRLYAEQKRSLLVVLQGIDTSGKDGTVRGVFNQCGPLGVNVKAFGKPSELELAHDYLWRVHVAMPRAGMIGVFNRSHYEDVLVVRVRKFAPADLIEQRYEQINAFEKHMTENGTTVLKFMLHISKDEQRKRLQERLDDPTKHWKFNPGDLDDRALWDDFQRAYEIALERCSTPHAPWRVVPADRKWRRNAIIASIVRGTLEEMNPQYPKSDWKPADFTIA
jgi:PPK2 family polyphosphate:nucleotide phosphotransferase